MAVDSGVFPQSALDENKSGRLSESQRQGIRSLSRGVRKSELSFAAIAVVFAVVIFVGVKPHTSVLVKDGVPVACLVVAAFLLFRAITGEDKLTRDLRNPRVESLEGPISKYSHTTTSHGVDGVGSSATSYYLTVAGKRFEVGPHAYREAPEAGFVCLYFLSISKHVVNLEHLPDRSLPEGSTPQSLIQEFKQATLSHDRARLDEIRAEAAGTENAFNAGISHDVTPPPAERRDQRPLAENIVGTWSNGPVTAIFADSGTFSITILGANQRSGHWSVDGSGRLVADLGGQSQSTDAWIVNDRLTVSFGESAFTLNRRSS